MSAYQGRLTEPEWLSMVWRNGVEYVITRDPDTGLQFVYADGEKIGQSQSEAGVTLIRRNHARDIGQHPPTWPNYIDNPYPVNSLDEGSDGGPEDY